MNQGMTESKDNLLDLTSESYRYWQQQLAGSPPLLELPTDKLRQSLIGSETSTHTIYLSESLMKSLQALSNRQEVSLFVTLLAAFKVLLYRDTDRPDLLVGSPSRGRDLDGWQLPATADNLVRSSLDPALPMLYQPIDRLVDNFHVLLVGIILDPGQSIGELPLLIDQERQQLLVDWNDTKVEYPDQCIHQLFEAQVLKTPEAIANELVSGNLTIKDLPGDHSNILKEPQIQLLGRELKLSLS